MKSTGKPTRKGKPPTNEAALWPADPATDTHNQKQIDMLLEYAGRVANLKERIQELEAVVESLRADLRRYA